MTSPASESWLRRARRRAGYQTVGAFARAIGVDVSTAGRYETGQIKTIPARRLHHIARALRLPQSEVWQRLRPDLTPPAENEMTLCVVRLARPRVWQRAAHLSITVSTYSHPTEASYDDVRTAVDRRLFSLRPALSCRPIGKISEKAS